MDYVFGRQPITFGDFSISGLAAVQKAAFKEEIRPGRAVNRSIDTATAEQRRVRSINDGVDRQCGDIGTKGPEFRRHDCILSQQVKSGISAGIELKPIR
jgi:hypothetical protein